MIVLSRPANPAVHVPPRWLAWCFRFLALGLGALHTAVAVRSQSMNEDGINYLDLGDAFWQGRWEDVVNTTWSPLYAVIVGGVMSLLQPSVAWEFPTVQLTNFAIFGLALLCFEYFWRQLSVSYFARDPGTQAFARFSPTVWSAIGYSLFIYVSLNLIAVWAVTPDMGIAAIVFLAAGLLLAVERDRFPYQGVIMLGLLLGVGYLVKAVMFPLGLALIALLVMLPVKGVGRAKRLVTALAAFLLVVAPWAAVVSSAVGHPTFSDVGRFTYLKHVNGMPWPQWQQASKPIAGQPVHPPRQILSEPKVWEFATPIGGTYPLGYDPAWWTQGLAPDVSIGEQVRTVVANGIYYFDLFLRMQGGLVATLALMLMLSLASTARDLRFDARFVLVAWPLAALALYALVFAESRYVAPFVLLLWAGLLARVRLPERDSAPRSLAAGGLLFALFAWINIAALNLEGLAGQLGVSAERGTGAIEHRSARKLSGGPKVRHPEIARALRDGGLAPGAQVAFIGYSYSAYWARLAKLRIVAEIHPEDVPAFWGMDEGRRVQVFDAIARTGAVAVIVEPSEAIHGNPGFTPIGGTGYGVRFLR